jgi:hypothetical protein
VLRPFVNVRWSSPHALADTLANLEGRAIGFLAMLCDVDDARGFNLSAAYFGRRTFRSFSRGEGS